VEERGDFTEKVRQFDGSKMLSPKAGVWCWCQQKNIILFSSFFPLINEWGVGNVRMRKRN
jgi:hypothetical protein